MLPQQVKFISFKDDSRYMPVKASSSGGFGIVLLKDNKLGEKEDIIEMGAKGMFNSISFNLLVYPN